MMHLEFLPQNWRNRCGRYEVVNDPYMKDATAELIDRDSFLMLQLNSKAESYQFVLTLLNHDQALTQGLGRWTRETVRFEKDNDGQEYMYFKGLKIQKSN